MTSPGVRAFLTLNGLIHWDALNAWQRLWLVISYVVFISFFLPVQVAVSLATLFLHAAGALIGHPPTLRQQQALGFILGLVGLMVACVTALYAVGTLTGP